MSEKDLVLTTRGGQEIRFTEGQYFEADDAIVILHEPLREVALKSGCEVTRIATEVAVWHNAKNFEFLVRAEGVAPDGTKISEVGEANSNPTNLTTTIAMDYPALMANKRALDRLLISLLGLSKDGFRIYSDMEIGRSRETKAAKKVAAADKPDVEKAPVAKATETKPPEPATPVASPAPAATTAEVENPLVTVTLEKLRETKVDFGTFAKSNMTLGKLKDERQKDFDWLVSDAFKATAPKMKALKAAALELARRESPALADA